MKKAGVKKVKAKVRKAKVKKAKAKVAKREAAVAAAKEDVEAREEAVKEAETTLAGNTIAGDGLYQVGKDIKAGTYQTAGKQGCSYAVLSGPSGIADATIVDGPAIVTVAAGQYLKLKGCADWVWQS